MFPFYLGKEMLRRHADFFDRDKDGKIGPVDIYQGMRSLRIDPFTCSFAAAVLPPLLGPKTGGNLLTINLDGISSSTHAPNNVGGFVKKMPKLTQNLYTKEDMKQLIRDRGGDPDTIAFSVEWGLLFNMLGKFRVKKNEFGVDVISREEILQLYDGSLFYNLAGE